MPLFQPCLTNPPRIQEIQQLVLKVMQALVGLEDLSGVIISILMTLMEKGSTWQSQWPCKKMSILAWKETVDNLFNKYAAVDP